MDVFIRDRRASVTLPDGAYPCIVLERDNWNDYSYFTLFKAQLRLAPGAGAGSVESLGDLPPDLVRHRHRVQG